MPESPFGKYLRRKRVELKFSLRRVADQIGVSHVYLGEVERGVRGPIKRERWASICEALPGVTEADLERVAGVSRPVQLDLNDAPAKYQDLGQALARRITERDLPERTLDELLALLTRNES